MKNQHSLLPLGRQDTVEITDLMNDRSYWKKHYVVESDAEEIERNIRLMSFISGGKSFELICFEQGKNAPNILISPGSGGHSYVFAELAYQMYLRGYNVFIMPKHGGHTISDLIPRHIDALKHISSNFGGRVGMFAEGLGGYTAFYMTLAGGPVKSIVYQNAPAIVTEEKFQRVILEGGGAAKRRQRLLSLVKVLARIFPWMKLPISVYLDFKEMVDTKEENRRIEEPRIARFQKDPDFDTHYPISAIMSLLTTPPPKPLSELNIPTMFLVPTRGLFPLYLKDLYSRLPPIKKKLVEVDGGVFWMCSHPREAAKVVCDWFDKTM